MLLQCVRKWLLGERDKITISRRFVAAKRSQNNNLIAWTNNVLHQRGIDCITAAW